MATQAACSETFSVGQRPFQELLLHARLVGRLVFGRFRAPRGLLEESLPKEAQRKREQRGNTNVNSA